MRTSGVGLFDLHGRGVGKKKKELTSGGCLTESQKAGTDAASKSLSRIAIIK